MHSCRSLKIICKIIKLLNENNVYLKYELKIYFEFDDPIDVSLKDITIEIVDTGRGPKYLEPNFRFCKKKYREN